MAILSFQQPDKVIVLESTKTVGKFEFRPLEPGFAQTIGNAIRRVLLSSLEGYAISQIKISGINQEFETIPGVIEGLQDIILNLKKVRFQKLGESSTTSEEASIVISGKQEFTAGDISKGLSSFTVLNPEQHICSMEPSVKIEMSILVTKGRGFVPADESRDDNAPIGTIAVDAIYTPIVNVNWLQENYRVEQKTDFEKLVLDIVTDGSITPVNALQEAAKILIEHFLLFTDNDKLTTKDPAAESGSLTSETDIRMRHLLTSKLSDAGLSVRAYNCLKAADIETFADLVSCSRSELMKFRNFGKKSLSEIDEFVAKYKLSFGMDVSKYNIEPRKRLN